MNERATGLARSSSWSVDALHDRKRGSMKVVSWQQTAEPAEFALK